MIDRLFKDFSTVNWGEIIIPVLVSILSWFIGRSWDYIKSIGNKNLSGFIGEFYSYYRSTVDTKNIIDLKISIYKNIFGIRKVKFRYPDGRKYEGYVYTKESTIFFKTKDCTNRFEAFFVFNNPIAKSFSFIKGTFSAISTLNYPSAGVQILSRNELSQKQLNSLLSKNSTLTVKPDKKNIYI